MNPSTLLTLVLSSVERSERSFICCAIDQHSEGNEALAKACMRYVEKYKPQGKKDFIGWWSLYDRKGRIAALKKAIIDAEKEGN